MRAVSNTSPISNLAMIGRLSLLKEQFTELWIPGAVALELAEHPDQRALSVIQNAIEEGWLQTANVSPSSLLNILNLHLHAGEAEAIALAVDIKSDIVVIDEQEGRQFASQAGLRVTGALGILLQAKRRGQISLIKPDIESLRVKARFFISPSLEAKILAAAGE